MTKKVSIASKKVSKNFTEYYVSKMSIRTLLKKNEYYSLYFLKIE